MKRKMKYGKSVRILWMFVVPGLIIFSCNKEKAPDCFQKAGEVKTISRSMEAFHAIELRDYITLELADSSDYGVVITGPSNLLPEIITEVKNGKLLIENQNTCNFVRSYRNKIVVRIYAPDFPDIQNFGTGDIRTVGVLEMPVFKLENRNAAGEIRLTLDTDTAIIASHTGVCDVIAEGKSQITQIFNQGVGYIDARKLHTTDAFVNNSSINDVYVNTNGYFFALIEFSGNVYYTGTPNHIDQSVRGEGRLMPLD